MPARKLTERQAAFVRLYVQLNNATQAAIEAGYSEKGATVRGSELLANRNVQMALQKERAKLVKRTEVSQDRVVKELARIGMADIRDLFEWDTDTAAFVPSKDLTADQAAAVASVKAETTHYTDSDGNTETKIKLELKMHDKLSALRMLGKHLGMFTERVQVDFRVSLLEYLDSLPPDEQALLEQMSDQELMEELQSRQVMEAVVVE